MVEDVDYQSLAELDDEIIHLLDASKKALEFAQQDNLSTARFLIELMHTEIDQLVSMGYDEYTELKSELRDNLEHYQQQEEEGGAN